MKKKKKKKENKISPATNPNTHYEMQFFNTIFKAYFTRQFVEFRKFAQNFNNK